MTASPCRATNRAANRAANRDRLPDSSPPRPKNSTLYDDLLEVAA